MTRILGAFAVLILAGSLVAADRPDAAAVPRVVPARVEGEYLIWPEPKQTPVTKEVDVLIEINGKPAVQKVTVTSTETVLLHRAVALKKLKFTDGAGKAIAAEKLAERLVEESPVVFHTGPLAAKYRALFANDAILVEFEAPPAPMPKP
jgi:hypothetical protein